MVRNRVLACRLAIGITAAGALCSPLSADEICYVVVVPQQSTDYSTTITVPKLDPAQGALTSIRFDLESQLAASVHLENTSGGPVTLSSHVFTAFVLVRPASSVIVSTSPSASFSDPLAPFDGTIDFAGPSGASHDNVLTTETASAVSPPPASDVALFSGTGTISLGLYVTGGGFVAGGGSNLVYGFTSAGSATVRVCYQYTPAVTPYCFGDGSGAPCPCGNSGQAGSGCANSVNAAGANLTGFGAPQVSADSFVLVATGLTDAPTLFFQGTAQQNGGLGTPFGDGLRCVTGTVVRLGTTTAASSSAQYPSAGQAPISVQGNIPSAGATRHYQARYRNSAAFCTSNAFNLTNGLTATWVP